MRLGLALVFVVLLTGCVAPGALTPQSGLPALDKVFSTAMKVGDDGNEPVMRVAPDGSVFIAALQHVWVSHDNGTSFTKVPATGNLPIYASDSALSISPGGRAYVAFDWPYAGQTAVCRSADVGKTWACVPVAVPGATDRMWVLAPNEKDVYLITGQTLDRPTFAVSHDGGASFAITSFDPRDTAQGEDLAWDPVENVVVEAAFAQGGAWGVRTWKPDGAFQAFTKMDLRTPEALVQVAPDGEWWALACVETTGKDCSLAAARSADRGKSWQTFPVPAAKAAREMEWITTGAPGHVALAWYEANGTSSADATNEWHVKVAWTTDDGATWSSQVVSDTVHKGKLCRAANCLGEDRFAGDFLGVAFGPDGALHATWMKQVGTKGVPTTQLSTGKWDDVMYARTG